jgi:hypothetical protein
MHKTTWIACLVGILCLMMGMISGCNEATGDPSGVNEESQIPSCLEIDLLGEISKYPMDSQGKLQGDVLCTSVDGKLTLRLETGTVISIVEGQHFEAIAISVDYNPPSLPPDNVFISPVYSFSLEQASLSLPVEVTIGYDPNKLPEGVKEEELLIVTYPYIGCCNVYEEWDMPRRQDINIETHTITTELSHLLRCTVIAMVETPPDYSSTQPTPTPTPTPVQTSLTVEKVELVYFHRAQRCYSCMYAEEGVRYTLETYFAEELADSTISFDVYNVEDENNAEIIEKYGAYTSSLFINTVQDGEDHIEEMNTIWLVVGDEEAFIKDVRDWILRSLGGKE